MSIAGSFSGLRAGRSNLDATRPKRRSLVTRSDEASEILGGRDIRRLVSHWRGSDILERSGMHSEWPGPER